MHTIELLLLQACFVEIEIDTEKLKQHENHQALIRSHVIDLNRQ